MATPYRPPTHWHILALYAFGVLGGSTYSALGASAYMTLWEQSPSDLPIAIVGGAIVGVVPGILSLLWVMYLLLGSNLKQSIPFVFLATCAASLIFGAVGPVALILIPAANIAACAFSYRRHNAATRRRRRGLCIACEYDLRGISGLQCPECGAYQRQVTVTLAANGDVAKHSTLSDTR